MLSSALKASGWLLARAPESVLGALAAALGDGIFLLFRRRRRLILSNLSRAFPGRPADWHRRVGRESCRRLIETAFLSLATPYLSGDRLRQIIGATPELLAVYSLHQADPRPTLICTAHLAYWEAQTSMPHIVPAPFPEFGTIYRPLDNAAADEWVRRSRERFGMRLLSRKEGFAEALKILRRRGFVGMLFDQNAGMQGALTTLLGRVCSTSELPGILARKFDARAYGIYPRRLGFWRLEIVADLVATGGEEAAVTIALNRWLEELIARDENLCCSWLWAHDRWRHQDIPAQRLRLESRRNLLSQEQAIRGWSALPRKTRVWIRLPNWLGDVVMLVPLLRAIRQSRPDAEITLLGRAQFQPLLERCAVADGYHALPDRGPGYLAHFRRLKALYIDTCILFTNSARGDLEARLTGAPQRFGIEWPGRRRFLLSHRWPAPAGEFAVRHQMDDWDAFLRHFGLATSADRRPLHCGFRISDFGLKASDGGQESGHSDSPTALRSPNSAIRNPQSAIRSVIGLIPGSENMPEKRWPVAYWRKLIEALPEERFVIFGTSGDKPVAAAVAAGFPAERVQDRAGQTDLLELAAALSACRALVSNDTGGMHLANAAGTPVIALFGPTNPVRTRPVFDSPVAILQPPGCPATGGGSLADLAPASVVAELRNFSRLSNVPI